MAPTIKVHRVSMGEIAVKEVDLEEARGLVEEARTQGNLVIDKETGDIIEEITPSTKEIFVVGVLGGG